MASWQPRQDPEGSPKPSTDWTDSGFPKATSSWPGAIALLPGWPLRPASLDCPFFLPARLLAMDSSAPGAYTWKANTQGPGDQAGLCKLQVAEHLRHPGHARGQEKLEEASSTCQEVAVDSPEPKFHTAQGYLGEVSTKTLATPCHGAPGLDVSLQHLLSTL